MIACAVKKPRLMSRRSCYVDWRSNRKKKRFAEKRHGKRSCGERRRNLDERPKKNGDR